MPGLIFEVIVTDKDCEKGQLKVLLHRFLAFSDLTNKQKEVDMAHFKKYRERLFLLVKVALF